MGTVLNAQVGTDAFTIASDDVLVRADNTELAWNGSSWEPAVFVNGTNEYFAGQFGAPSTPASSPQFGDNLLGAVTPGGGDPPPTITLTFAQTLAYISFEVSSASSSNFVAQLLAFNAQGQQIGTYQVSATGLGGFCPGLAMNPPQPCNDAPLIQFYDPTQSIASVELVMMNDDSGVFIDELETGQLVPEPVSWLLLASGLLFMALWPRRGRLRNWAAGARVR